jgi:hypothetical protein
MIEIVRRVQRNVKTAAGRCCGGPPRPHERSVAAARTFRRVVGHQRLAGLVTAIECRPPPRRKEGGR